MNKTAKIIILIALIISLCSCNNGTELPTNTTTDIKIDETDENYSLLKKSEFFATGIVGGGGDTPMEIEAFAQMIKYSDAKKYFIKLEEEANNEGKLYALCGLYSLDKEYFYTILDSYINSEDKVITMDGCMKQEEVFKDISDNFVNGKTPESLAKYIGIGNNETSSIEINETDENYLILKSANHFSYGPTGAGGSMSKEVVAFYKVFKYEDAMDYFKKLETDANSEGKLYALCGLYLLDKTSFDNLIDKYINSNDKVLTLSGCLGSTKTVKEISNEFINDKTPKSLMEYIENQRIGIIQWVKKETRKINKKDKNYILLKKAKFFATGGVGIVGEKPDEIEAFAQMIRYSDAKNYFVKLEEEANNEGKLYALCGLYFLDKEYYYAILDNYMSSKDKVTTMGGCIQQEEMFKDLYSGFCKGIFPTQLKEYSDPPKAITVDGSVKNEQQAIEIAKLYVLEKYANSFEKYKITARLKDNIWTIIYYHNPNEYDGGGPYLTIDAITSKVTNCGLQV